MTFTGLSTIMNTLLWEGDRRGFGDGEEIETSKSGYCSAAEGQDVPRFITIPI